MSAVYVECIPQYGGAFYSAQNTLEANCDSCHLIIPGLSDLFNPPKTALHSIAAVGMVEC